MKYIKIYFLEKNLKQKLKPLERFRHSLLEWTFPRNKNKWKSTTEVLPSKFNWKEIQWKENSTENSAEKNLKENLKFNELWNFSIKQKKKRKILKFKEFVSGTLSQISFPQVVPKICNTLSFLSLSLFFLCMKFLLKKFIVCVIFSYQYLNSKAVELTV